MNLSKSKYCAGLQCPKVLWMDRNMPEQKAAQDETRMIIGNYVGDIAMGYFGEFAEVPFDRENMGNMLTETRRLLEAGAEVIAEASFSYDGNFCSVDILRKTGGSYEIFEVKSSSCRVGDSPRNVKEIYLDDMAYQYYVLTLCGMNVSRVSLLQLNKDYVRCGELDLQELFVSIDCTELVLQMQAGVPKNIDCIKSIAEQNTEPEMQIGSGCEDCAYRAWCFGELPELNVFDIGWRMYKVAKDDAYQSGYVSFEEVLDSGIKLSDLQLLQLKTALHNLPPHIEAYSIRRFLSGLTYPLYYLDFETCQQAIPLWDGVRPYQQIPFQYSLHIQDALFAEPQHREFLGKEGLDPRRALAERLCADIPCDVCVLAYNAGFEKGRIRELAELFPDLSVYLMSIHANIKDLADPFSKGYYYCREMGGSYSIKAVLPALCSGDPELDYKKLNIIHNGSEAMNAFAGLHEKTPEEISEIRTALLEYCRLDTLAMVKILEKLYEAVN